jgi:hypothetical protein
LGIEIHKLSAKRGFDRWLTGLMAYSHEQTDETLQKLLGSAIVRLLKLISDLSYVQVSL